MAHFGSRSRPRSRSTLYSESESESVGVCVCVRVSVSVDCANSSPVRTDIQRQKTVLKPVRKKFSMASVPAPAGAGMEMRSRSRPRYVKRERADALDSTGDSGADAAASASA